MQQGIRRISASSYSNTAPLIWSFLYGSRRGEAELILDNAPARSAELLMSGRVDSALVPVIAYQMIEGVRLVRDVCVGASSAVRSVRLVTRGMDLRDVKSVSLDVSSKTSVCLTKIIFSEFLGLRPEFRPALPDPDAMLAESDCALLIGDPALALTADGVHEKRGLTSFDIVEVWRKFTGFGFVFAMWMSPKETPIDLAAARDEGVAHIEDIAANYAGEIGISAADMTKYLSKNISYSIDDEMQKGLELYFELAAKHKLIDANKPLNFL